MGCGGCRFQIPPQRHREAKGVSKMPQGADNPERISVAPEFHPEDSSITFPEGVELFEVEGYSVDEDDARRLICNMPICQTRMAGFMMQKDGTYQPHFVCMGDCEHKSTPVTFDICSACPVRSEGGL